MKKIFSFLAALLLAGSMMAQTNVVVADPQPAAAPAQPTLPADSVLAIYSNIYPVNPGWGYCEGWGQTTTLQELNLDGNHVLYYKNFNYLGWGCSGIVDASAYTKLHIDFWAPAAGSINVYPIYGGGGLNTNDQVYKTVNVAEGWNALEFDLATDFANLNFSSIFQFKFADAQGFTVFAVDNVYFYGKQANAVNYTSLNDVYSLANGDTVILKDFEVVYVNGRYTYIKDATASGLIYKSNYGLVAGDQVAKGMQAKISVYNNLYELVPITALADLTVTAGTPAQPALATAAPTAADNKYMVYKNVKFLKDSIGTSSSANRTVQGMFGRDTITFYNAFPIPAMTFDSAKSYDVTGFNSCYKANIQVYVATIEEHPDVADPCAGQHGLYDPATAAINSTYFATSGWGINAGCTADITNGTITIHVDQPFVDMWQGQVFVDPGFTFEAGKAYHYEFDITSAGKVCITVKVNDSDTAFFFNKVIYDINQGGGTYHFSTDSVFANANINPAKGPLVFGFGWTDGNQDITISCIKITEVGDAPEPVEEHMYIKHPWGTGIDTDWTWQEMTATKYNNAFDAWTYTGAWGGVGFNIADNAEGNNAKWFSADVIGFRSKDGQLAPAPAVGTADCEFIYVPAYDKEGAAVPAAYVYYEAATGVDNTAAQIESVKIIRDGQLIIIRDGVEYNVLGLEIR